MMFKSTEERIPCHKGDTVRNKKTKEKYIIFQSSYNSNLGKVIESTLWQNIEIDGKYILIGIAGRLYNKEYQIYIQGKWLSR